MWEKSDRPGRAKSWLRRFSVIMASLVFMSLFLSTKGISWQDISQHKSSEHQTVGAPITHLTVVLNKFERGPDGTATMIPISGAKFFLFAEDGTLAGGIFTTDEYGQVILTSLRLPPGNYYFEEVSPAPGYEFDQDDEGNPVKRYPFTVTRDHADETVVVTAYNRRITGAMTLRKFVERADGQELTPEMLETEFAFTVTFSDDGAYPYLRGEELVAFQSGGTLLLKHGEEVHFPNLPVGISYSVKETPVPDYAIRSENHAGTITPETIVVTFYNIWDDQPPPDEEAEILIRKKVEGTVPDSELEHSYPFVLMVDGVERERFFLKDGGTTQFGIPYGALYEVYEEAEVGAGYIRMPITNGYGTVDRPLIEVEQVNFYPDDPDEEEILLEGEKHWDLSGCQVDIPDSIRIRIMNGSTRVYTLLVTAENNWKWSLSLPKYDSDGKEIKYWIVEEPVEGFGSVVTGFDITNTYRPPTQTDLDLTVEKQIEGSPDELQTFQFDLKAGSRDTPMPDGSLSGVKTVSVTGTGTAGFGTIAYTKEGTYQYEITERTVDDVPYQFDTAVYLVTVTVSYDEAARSLQKDVQIVKSTEAGQEEWNGEHCLFTNRYLEPEPDPEPEPEPEPGPEKPDPGKPGPQPEPGPDTDTPKTSDSPGILYLLVTIMAASAAAVVICCRKRRD